MADSRIPEAAPEPRDNVIRRLRRAVRIYRALASAAVRSEAQYRGNLAMWVVGGVAYQGVGFAFIWVVIERLGAIRGWTLGEVAFLYGMRLTSHALFTMPLAEMFGIDYVVRQGQFDRYLVRPINPFIQVVTGRLRLQTLGDAAGGFGMLAVASSLAPVHWSVLSVLYLLAALIGGAAVEAGLNTVVSAFAFRTLSVRSMRLLVDGVFTTFGGYPLTVLSGVTRFLLTFVLPLAFVAYFPATVLLRRTGELSVPPVLAEVAPGVGFALFGAALWFWHGQIKHYVSSGH